LLIWIKATSNALVSSINSDVYSSCPVKIHAREIEKAPFTLNFMQLLDTRAADVLQLGRY